MGPVGDVILQQYVVDVRERVEKTNLSTSTFLMWPHWHCQHMGERGRCHNKVSKIAIIQRCNKHQRARGLMMSLNHTDSLVDPHQTHLRDHQ